MVKDTRIGLFGGTFDPIHFGHLRPAIEVAEHYRLASLFVMPNHRPAHRGPTGANTQHRISMLEIAIDGVPLLAIDTREAIRDKPTYTFDTLVELRYEHPDATLLFFLGMDSFRRFDTWHKWEAILELTNLVVINRPGARHTTFSKDLLERQQKASGDKIVNGSTGVIETCDVTQLEISATDIRRRIASDQSVRFLLPDAVSEYIDAHNLYRS